MYYASIGMLSIVVHLIIKLMYERKKKFNAMEE